MCIASLTASNFTTLESATPIDLENTTLTAANLSLRTPPITAGPGLPNENPSTLNFIKPHGGGFYGLAILIGLTFNKALTRFGHLTNSLRETLHLGHFALN